MGTDLNRLVVNLATLALVVLVGSPSDSSAQVGTSPDVGVRFNPPKTILLTNAHVVIDSAREIEKSDVLIRDYQIAAVGKQLPVPPEADVIDCTGKYLYPAFVDAFAEFTIPTVDLPAAHWNDYVLPQRRMEQLLKKDDKQLAAYRKAGIGVVLAAPADRIFKGSSCVLTLSDQSLEVSLLRSSAFQHLRLLPARGAGRGGYPNSPMGAVALARQTFIDTIWYQQAWQSYQADRSLPKPDHNVALEALASTARGGQTLMIDGPNELYALRADRFAREFSLKAAIRGSGREYRQLDAIAATRRTFIIPVNFPKPPDVGSAEAAIDVSLQSLMHWHLAPENPGRLEKANVSFVLTADGLATPTDLLPNVRKAVERGLSAATALAALTTRPAELLEVDNLVGSIETGKLANILVCSGPLLNKSTKILDSFVQGTRYRFDDKPAINPSGKWELKLTGGGDFPAALELELSDMLDKPKGKIAQLGELEKEAARKPKPITQVDSKSESPSEDPKDAKDPDGSQPPPLRISELKQLGLQENRMAAVFETKQLGIEQSGMALLAAAMIPNGSSIQLSGSIVWPDGRSSLLTGERASDIGGSTPKTASDAKTSEKSAAGKQESSDKKSDALVCEVNFPLGDFGTSGQPQPAEWLLIRGATVWTCSEPAVIESGDVLVHQGKIESVGKDLKAPAGAVIVEAAGKHVSPGIIDCHSHMATDGGVNESGQAVTAEVRIGDFLDANDITIYRQLAGGVTSANVLHGSANPIGGQNQVIKLRWGALDEDLKMVQAPPGIKFALGENVKQSNFSDRSSTRYPQSRMGVEQIIRDRFEAAKLYAKKRTDWTSNARGLPPRRDLELDALVEVLEGKRWIHCHSYRQDEILTFLRLLEEYKVQVGSLQHILEGYKVADAMAKHGATGSSFSDWWAYKFEVFDAIPFNGALMHRAGVIVSFNSDDSELARHLNHEAAKAIKYGGIAPEEALKFVTLNPAKQLRIDKWVGSLDAGKDADFVVWRGSPLSTLSVCEQTWIDGRKYFDLDEDRRQRSKAAQLRQQLIQAILKSGEKMGSGEGDRSDPSTWWVRYDEFCHHHDHDELDATQQGDRHE